MTKKAKRVFKVSYYLEQGFVVCVKASSELAAERIVRRYLDNEADELPLSTRDHFDGNVVETEEVRS